MDVKFPLDNYLRYLEAETDNARERYKADFLRDVKNRLREVTRRDYVAPEHNTVDCMLLFIPNEQVYGFIHELDPSIIDEAMKSRIVLCSPVTLFAVLAVIRQALDNFALEQTSAQMLSHLGSFKKQWENFQESLEKLGRHIRQTHDEYEHLTTTRRRQLEKPLDRLEALRLERGLPEGEAEEPEAAGEPPERPEQ